VAAGERTLELTYLSDRLYSRAISDLPLDTPNSRRDMLIASRALTRLLRMYERASRRTLSAVMLDGEGL
jgi:hypothetical protein